MMKKNERYTKKKIYTIYYIYITVLLLTTTKTTDDFNLRSWLAL